MSRGYAFEVTAEDIFVVLTNAGIDKSYEDCMQLIDMIDEVDVEDAALHGDDLDEQTKYAHEEILRQLAEKGLISSGAEAPALG